jgi:mannose-6-phosphate isomerase-like protein (cupin superfamily)
LWKTINSKTLPFSPYRTGHAHIKRVIEQSAVGTKRIAGLGLIEVPPGGVFPSHTHPEREEVYYVLAGSGSILVDDETVQAEEGLTFYVSGETRHGMKNLGRERLLVLYVTVYV